MITRIGRYEYAAGVTSRYGRPGERIVGLYVTKLSGGYTLHFLLGRFGAYVGYWGPLPKPQPIPSEWADIAAVIGEALEDNQFRYPAPQRERLY